MHLHRQALGLERLVVNSHTSTQPTTSANEYASLALEVGGKRVPIVQDGSGADVAVLDIPSTGVTPYAIVINLHKRPPGTGKEFNSLQACIHMGGETYRKIGKPRARRLPIVRMQGQKLAFAPVQVAEGGSDCATNVAHVGEIQVEVKLAKRGTSTNALPPSSTLPFAAAKVPEGKQMVAVQTVSAGACSRRQVVGCEYGDVFARLRIKYARRTALEMHGVLKPGTDIVGPRSWLPPLVSRLVGPTGKPTSGPAPSSDLAAALHRLRLLVNPESTAEKPGTAAS